MSDESWPLMPTEYFPPLPPEGGKARRKAMKVWMGDPLEHFGPIWCPVAHMVAERPYGPAGPEIKRGSRHFAPGAKLYVHRWVGIDQIEVVGHHRASHRYVTMIVSAAWLVDWRAELAYSPRVIVELWPKWGPTPESKVHAEQWARAANTASASADSRSIPSSDS